MVKNYSQGLLQGDRFPFWITGLLLGSGQGLTSMLVGGGIAKISGAGVAITSILIGNFILWFIGIGIISMTEERSHSLQNIKEHLNGFATKLAAIVITTAFIIWFALHLEDPTEVVKVIFKNDSLSTVDLGVRASAIMGIICTLISMGGIKSIKWINTLSFPFLVCFLGYFLITTQTSMNFSRSWGFSFPGIIAIVLTWLPGTVNLSTFFQYSRSRADSILALTLMMGCHIFFQSAFVCIGVGELKEFLLIMGSTDTSIGFVVGACFILISFFCVNLMNIYWASVGLGVFFTHKQESKGYAVIGLIGTVTYVFFQSTSLINLLEMIGTASIAALGVALIASYLIQVFVQHRPRKIEKLTDSICWIISSLIGGGILFFGLRSSNQATIISINICLLAFAFVVFIEESMWALKKLRKTQK